MSGNPIRGANYLLRGFSMVMEPGLRAFVVVPLTINVVLFAIAIYTMIQLFSVWVGALLDWMPDWLNFIDWLLWPIFALLVLVVIYFGFGVVTNFIAAPFNGILAERVEQRLRGATLVDEGWKAMLAMIPRALQREMAKLIYMLPRFLLLLVITFIPVVGLFSPILWFLFGAWMMAIQYCDYPMDNNHISFKDLRTYLKQKRITSLGFGGLVSAGMLVPVLNLVIMPAAVVGATIYWVEEFAPSDKDISGMEDEDNLLKEPSEGSSS